MDDVQKHNSFIYKWLYSPLLGPDLFSFVICLQTVELIGRGISPLGRYLHTEQHKLRINAHTDIHASSGIRNNDPSVPASEDSSCLRPGGHCDRPRTIIFVLMYHRHKLLDLIYLTKCSLWKCINE
jgi:hypothetical protein